MKGEPGCHCVNHASVGAILGQEDTWDESAEPSTTTVCRQDHVRGTRASADRRQSGRLIPLVTALPKSEVSLIEHYLGPRNTNSSPAEIRFCLGPGASSLHPLQPRAENSLHLLRIDNIDIGMLVGAGCLLEEL